MTVGRRAPMLCLLSLTVFSWSEPASALAWGPPRLTERSYEGNHEQTGSAYNSHVQHKFNRYHWNYPPDFGQHPRESHSWHDHHVPRGYDAPPRERPYYREYFPHQNRQGQGENFDTSGRTYDGGYVAGGPQLLGDAELGKTEIMQTHQSDLVKNVKIPREKRRISKKLFVRRKRDEGAVEISETPSTTVDVITEETAQLLEETARAFTQPDRGGSHAAKRPNAGQAGKGPSTRRGQNKPKETSSWNNGKRNNTKNTNVVFPNSESEETVMPAFTPSNTLCAKKNTFCEDKAEYPNSYIRNLLEKEGSRFRAIFGNDSVPETNIVLRVNSDETELCSSHKRVIFPTKAKNKDDKWQFVINQDGYTQGIGVEICLNADESCKIASAFPLSYETSCRQKYITRRLLSLNENGGPGMSEFLFPSCCVCTVRSTVGGTSSKLKP